LRIGGKQAQPQRPGRGAEGGGHAQVPLKDRGQPFLAHHLQRFTQSEEDADRRRGEGHPFGLHLRRALPIEVEARRAGVRLALPGRLADAQHGHAGWKHPSLLRRRDRDIDVPPINGQVDGADPTDPVDHQQPVVTLDHFGQRLQWIGHAGRGFVVGNQYGCDVRLASEQVVEIFGIRRLAPGHRQSSNAGAEPPGQVGEAIPERADRDREETLARRHEVGDGALQPTGSARGEDQHVVVGLEGPPQTDFELGQKGPELRATVIDHGRSHRLLHAIGHGRRAGDSQLMVLSHAS